jgi:hypothetical protein
VEFEADFFNRIGHKRSSKISAASPGQLTDAEGTTGVDETAVLLEYEASGPAFEWRQLATNNRSC